MEPYESEANQNQPDDSDFEDDDFSISSSRSSMVSNAPSVQHFNISVRCLMSTCRYSMFSILHDIVYNQPVIPISLHAYSSYSRRPFVSMKEPGHFARCVPYSRWSTCAL